MLCATLLLRHSKAGLELANLSPSSGEIRRQNPSCYRRECDHNGRVRGHGQVDRDHSARVCEEAADDVRGAGLHEDDVGRVPVTRQVFRPRANKVVRLRMEVLHPVNVGGR